MTRIFDLVVLALAETYNRNEELKDVIYFLLLLIWVVGVANAVREYFLNSDKIDSLFISKKGNPLAIRTMEDNFKKILAASKINVYFNVTPHTLRHSFASHLNDKDVDIIILQNVLGHSTPRSTEIYIHPSEKRVREALEKLPGVRYINQLIETGALRFQKRYRKRLCIKLNKKKAKAI